MKISRSVDFRSSAFTAFVLGKVGMLTFRLCPTWKEKGGRGCGCAESVCMWEWGVDVEGCMARRESTHLNMSLDLKWNELEQKKPGIDSI